MILIADSGSTSTDWLYLEEGQENRLFRSSGLNPVIRSISSIGKILDHTFPTQALNKGVNQIYFFGAGCSDQANCKKLDKELKRVFPFAQIEVQSDLIGAIRALVGDEAGVCCILGTGSNSCYFDGHHVAASIPSLGYIVGDEGSGNYLGKQLLRHYFYRELPEHLAIAFEQAYHLTKDDFIENLYEKSGASRYLASYAPFLARQQRDPFIRSLVWRSFDLFLERTVLKYPQSRTFPVHFVGSIAFYFREILIEALNHKGLKVGRILKQPIQSLGRYYKQ